MSTLEFGESLGVPRERLCEVLDRGSATSKAVSSIAVFGGTLDVLAPIAGALLQKDVRHAASLADDASAPGGHGVHASPTPRWTSHGPPALMRCVGFVGAGRMGAPMVRRLVEAGHHVHALGRTDEKRTAIAELGAHPVADLAAVADGADAVVVCVFTDEQVSRCASTTVCSAPCGAARR